MDALEDYIEALQQITEAKGAYSRDPQTHALNTIRDMQATAVNVLRKWGVRPRRDDSAFDGKPIPLREFERAE